MEFEKKDLSKTLLDGGDGRKEEQVAHETQEKNMLIRCCRKLDNKAVLLIICCLFAFFASAEMVGALYANSLSLLGDATSSLVDVLTYASNYYAEYLVTPSDGTMDEENDWTEPSKKKLVAHIKLDARTKLIHEVYVPTFSLISLFAVTLFIFSMSVIEISKGGDDNTNVNMMYAFASVNTVVDIICFTMFYFRKDDFLHHRFPSVVSVSDSSADSGSLTAKPPPRMLRDANINMVSALTHVSCDGLRIIAIFIAAITSSTSGVKSSLCDAWAAIAVSITILFAMIPLSIEVYAAFTGKR